jgi:proteasome lid subunit RPN8/RPN11
MFYAKYLSRTCFALSIFFAAASLSLHAQSVSAPLTSQELVRLVYQLPAHPEKRDEIIEEIRQRGINFDLTDGLRSVIATKSSNDVLLRRTLEEAERRRLNPTAAALPSEAEGQAILDKARAAALAATEAMPDFIVKQLITRSYARNMTNNWQVADRLTVAVSYRQSAGEEYKVLAVNGMPTGEASERPSYEQLGGTSSTGEYVSMLAALFNEATHTQFKMVDTDVLRGRRTIVYEFAVEKRNSHQMIKAEGDRQVVTAYHGRIWVDRENYRVLRIENISSEIPVDFPVTAASSMIDYDWATIADKQYLLPSRAIITLASGMGAQTFQSRNDIRFRNYQKFGAEVKITDVDEADDQDTTEQKPAPKPAPKKP